MSQIGLEDGSHIIGQLSPDEIKRWEVPELPRDSISQTSAFRHSAGPSGITLRGREVVLDPQESPGESKTEEGGGAGLRKLDLSFASVAVPQQ